jgi:hypothetical protein
MLNKIEKIRKEAENKKAAYGEKVNVIARFIANNTSKDMITAINDAIFILG